MKKLASLLLIASITFTWGVVKEIPALALPSPTITDQQAATGESTFLIGSLGLNIYFPPDEYVVSAHVTPSTRLMIVPSEIPETLVRVERHKKQKIEGAIDNAHTAVLTVVTQKPDSSQGRYTIRLRLVRGSGAYLIANVVRSTQQTATVAATQTLNHLHDGDRIISAANLARQNGLLSVSDYDKYRTVGLWIKSGKDLSEVLERHKIPRRQLTNLLNYLAQEEAKK